MAQDGDRPLRICNVCGGIDDHPRHVIATPPGDPLSQADAALIRRASKYLPDGEAGDVALAELLDDSTASRHMDCCAEVGCPDGSCTEVRAGAEGLRGNALLKHLTGQGN